MCKCDVCGKENYSTNSKKYPKNFCSYKCYEKWNRINKSPNCECAICGKKMYLKEYRIKRAKNGVTCSKECCNKLKTQYSKGNCNHQFGLIGDSNASFAGNLMTTNYGYILEYCPNHPYPHDKSTKTCRVLQHRLVVERNYTLFNECYFENINGVMILKPQYVVHHINEDKTDNNIANLAVMTLDEHSTLHNKNKEILRDDKGRIIGVFKPL